MDDDTTDESTTSAELPKKGEFCFRPGNLKAATGNGFAHTTNNTYQYSNLGEIQANHHVRNLENTLTEEKDGEQQQHAH